MNDQSTRRNDSPPVSPQPALPAAEAVPIFQSTDLFRDSGNEVRIVHEGMTYRLLITRNHKLILVK